MPSEKGLEPAIQLINDVDEMLKLYAGNPAAFFQIFRDLLASITRDVNTETNADANADLLHIAAGDTSEKSISYRDHCLTILLQNYVSYVLFFDFNEIRMFVQAFQDTPKDCSFIISKMFTDTIFLQKMMRQQQIDLAEYPEVTRFFNENALQWYL